MLNTIKNFLIMLNNLQQTLEACSKRVIQKIAEATDELIGNKIADRVIKVSKNSEQNNLETVTNEKDK